MSETIALSILMLCLFVYMHLHFCWIFTNVELLGYRVSNYRQFSTVVIPAYSVIALYVRI